MQDDTFNDNYWIDKDNEDNYIKTNSLHQTMLVPAIYAIGECTRHNTKRSVTTVCNHILGR